MNLNQNKPLNSNHSNPLVNHNKPYFFHVHCDQLVFYATHLGMAATPPSAEKRPSEQHLRGVTDDGLVTEGADFRSKPMGFSKGMHWDI